MGLLARKCTFPVAALGLLGLIAALVWWANVSPAQAQVQPHVFKGKVVIDGRPAPDGTLVVALIDGDKGNKVGETKTQRGTFRLAVVQPSGQVFLRKIVNFYGETPDGKQFPFPQTARWQPGGETTIALEVVGVFRPVRELPPPAAAFSGKVIFDGRPVEDGTQVTAYIDGARLSGTVVTRGVFRLVVTQPSGKSFAGKIVEFRSVVLRRRITWPQTAVWKPGQISVTLQAGSQVREQQLPAAVVSGKVIFDGRPVEDGTKVTAHIDGVRISSTRTKGSTFRLVVSQPSGQSFAGRPVDFSGNTPQGSRISWPQTVVWKPGEIFITLQADVPRVQQPPAHVFEGKAILDGRPAEDGTQVTAHIDGVRISGTRTRGGRFRLVVPQPLGQSFAGRLVEFKGRTTQDRRIDWLKSAVWRGGESSITLGPEVRYPSGQPRPDQPQVDRVRSDEELRLERDRLEQERKLQEERARLDQERDKQEQLRIEQEFAQREERLRRELEGRNSVTQDQPPPQTEGEPSKKGLSRGFFTNSQVGQLGNLNTSVDPTMLAVIGILLTLGATTLQLFRGN